MNSKAFKLIIIMSIIIFLTSCSSEYSKLLNIYESLFENTVKLLDSEKVYESITNNKLSMNLEQLDKLLADIEENVPDNKIDDFIVLRTKHEFLKEIIEKGLKWNSLGNLDRLSIKESINMFQSN